MKKVKKKTNTIPKPLDNCNNKIEKAMQEKGSHNFSGYYYASDNVKKRLQENYNNKCAFCESDTTAGAVLQVEHYRPKAKITEEASHNGYYWLGYEWTNLLYACSSCNRAKSTFFPIEQSGVRVYNPPIKGTKLDISKCKIDYEDLINEKPLILNPEEKDFNPELHLIISPKGKIRHRTERGKITIEKCKLHRKNLALARKKIVNDHLSYMMIDFERFKDGIINIDQLKYGLQKEIEQIIDRVNKNKPYTLLAKQMLKYFDYFFTKRFQAKEQTILSDVYREIWI
ncbi:MAG: hypothetical protein KAI79_09695 [Bacteroidales bacterium]|nr:hypothetical protein [Bacteroidales bacterium]